MTVAITLDGRSAKDKMKSKKNAITLHRTTKDLELKTDTIRLVKCFGNQPADIVQTHVMMRYNIRWKTLWMKKLLHQKRLKLSLQVQLIQQGGQNF